MAAGGGDERQHGSLSLVAAFGLLPPSLCSAVFLTTFMKLKAPSPPPLCQFFFLFPQHIIILSCFVIVRTRFPVLNHQLVVLCAPKLAATLLQPWTISTSGLLSLQDCKARVLFLAVFFSVDRIINIAGLGASCLSPSTTNSASHVR